MITIIPCIYTLSIQDDEIADDETIERPPPLRYLVMSSGNARPATGRGE